MNFDFFKKQIFDNFPHLCFLLDINTKIVTLLSRMSISYISIVHTLRDTYVSSNAKEANIFTLSWFWSPRSKCSWMYHYLIIEMGHFSTGYVKEFCRIRIITACTKIPLAYTVASCIILCQLFAFLNLPDAK